METQRQNATVVIAASIIAAIRLRGEEIKRSPKVVSIISDSVRLAEWVLEKVESNR